ncbi:MAG: hypothetical protein MHMPM18_001467 [Marteilia pararefringens]
MKSIKFYWLSKFASDTEVENSSIINANTSQDSLKTMIIEIEKYRFVNLNKIGEIITAMKKSKPNIINVYIDGLKNLFIILIDRSFLDITKKIQIEVENNHLEFYGFIYFHYRLKEYLEKFIFCLRTILEDNRLKFLHASIIRAFDELIFSKSLNFSSLINYLFDILVDKNQLNKNKAMYLISKISQRKKFYHPTISNKIYTLIETENFKQYKHKFLNIMNEIKRSSPDISDKNKKYLQILSTIDNDNLAVDSKAYAVTFCSKIDPERATSDNIEKIIENINNTKQSAILFIYLKFLQKIFQSNLLKVTTSSSDDSQSKCLVPWQLSLLCKHSNALIRDASERLAGQMIYKISSDKLNAYSMSNIFDYCNGASTNTSRLFSFDSNDEQFENVKNTKLVNNYSTNKLDDDIVSIESDEFDQMLDNF